ncbi:MAG: cupredoxin domain-containing protein [Acidimicrobiales bacterium]
MSRAPAGSAPVVAVALAGAMALGACSSSTASGPTVAVTATDTACQVGTASLPAGRHAFSVQNNGNQVTEVYVYADGDKVMAERENIGPGTSARFTVSLRAGTYTVACKPGQTGTGIRQPLTVT